MYCYEIVRLDYKMSSSSANGASTTGIYILSPSLALVHHHFCQIHQYSLICILQCYCTLKKAHYFVCIISSICFQV